MKKELAPFKHLNFLGRKLVLFLCLSALTMVLLLLSENNVYSADSSPYDDLSLLISKYGKPDVDDSTQYDKPRPPIVTRWLIYKKEKVRVWYVPAASMDNPPPYRKWKFLGFADEKTKKPISAAEADRRLQRRLKKP